MPKFEKQFVYFMWDSTLEGKTVFFADYIPELQQRVENNDVDYYEKVTQSEVRLPFRMVNIKSCWQFAYYDPYYELKYAHEHGKKIQVLSKDKDKWLDVSNPCWDVEPEAYRVKPEEAGQEQKQVTKRELAQWLAEGYGQFTYMSGDAAAYHYGYIRSEGSTPVDEDIRVRLWGDTEWHMPTHKYMYSEDQE